jgi:hypothetical protein
MISIAIKENGGALAIQSLQGLGSDAVGEVGNGFARDLTTIAVGGGHLRRIPHPVHLNQLEIFDHHGIESSAHDATARGFQFHSRQQVHERSRLIVQFGAGHKLFSGREAVFKAERGTQEPEFGGLVNFHENFSGRSRE